MGPVRSRMTHRCATQREVAGTLRDPFNNPITGPVTILSNSACYWQEQSARFVFGEKVAAISTNLLLLPKLADVLEGDIITSISNRRATPIFSKRLRVTGVVQREDHIECLVEVYS